MNTITIRIPKEMRSDLREINWEMRKPVSEVVR